MCWFETLVVRDREEEDDAQEDRKRRRKTGWDIDVLPPPSEVDVSSLIKEGIQASLNARLASQSLTNNIFNIPKPVVDTSHRIYVGYSYKLNIINLILSSLNLI